MTEAEMAAALRALGWRLTSPAELAACKHPRMQSSGTCRSDGYSELWWHCPDCGKSGHSSTRARTDPDPIWLLQNMPVVAEARPMAFDASGMFIKC